MQVYIVQVCLCEANMIINTRLQLIVLLSNRVAYPFAFSDVLSEPIFSWVLKANICLGMFIQVFIVKRKLDGSDWISYRCRNTEDVM